MDKGSKLIFLSIEVNVIRLYVETPLFLAQELLLSEPQSHYLQKVMRLKKGSSLHLFNGKDGEWHAEVIDLLKKVTKLKVISQIKQQKPESDLWLLYSPLKPKRQEFLIEKATELGVSCLWPIHCGRTSIPKVNLEKMKAHVIEAAEQCERLTLPEIKPLTPLSKVLKEWPSNRTLIFGDETLSSPSIATLSPKGPCAFFVGPEGGFTEQELSALKTQGRGVTLNLHILRAETAALVGISCLQLIPFSDKRS